MFIKLKKLNNLKGLLIKREYKFLNSLSKNNL